MSIWKKLKKFPPVLVRLLARKPDGTGMTDAEVCAISNGALSLADVKHLSYATTWDNISVWTMYYFTVACGVDFGSPKAIRNANRYLRDPKFRHLRLHPEWPSFKDMLRVYASTLKRT